MEEPEKLLCIICDEVDLRGNLQKVKSGITTLLAACESLSRLQLKETLENARNIDNCQIYVHNSCRKHLYNEANGRDRSTVCEPPHKRRALETRINDKSFSWKENCFICGKKCVGHKEKWSLCDVKMRDSPESTKTAILSLIKNNEDEQSQAIFRRLSSCSDLPAVEARYHRSCRSQLNIRRHMRLVTPEKKPSGQRGRRPQEAQSINFDRLCKWLEAEAELHSLSELFEKMLEISDDPSDRTQIFSDIHYLKKKLKERYGENLFFSKVHKKENVVCFKASAGSILNKAWYSAKNENSEKEALRVVETAANLVLLELRSYKQDMTIYPSETMISDLEYNKEQVPQLLRAFLSSLMNNELRQVAIGQSIVHACRPKSTMPPILFGLTIELDHVFGSKWLLTELNRLGFSLDYEENRRFKQSVVANDDIDAYLNSVLKGSFSQWSADNVDHNVKTIDGKGSLHGMGIIVSTTGGDVQDFVLPAVKRNKKLLNDSVIQGKGVPIVQYRNSAKSNDSLGSKFINLSSLSLDSLHRPADSKLDLLWHVSHFRGIKATRPGWSGYMQEISQGEFPGRSQINMLPIIDLDPSNMTCIYSTLLFVCDQAKRFEVHTPVITFDQPLWIKATEIVENSDLKIVLILGGFHMMMSFAGSVGTLMAGSGLNTALETVYGPVSVKHMLSGKAIAMFLRGNFLVESALVIMLLSMLLPSTGEAADGDVRQLECSEEAAQVENSTYQQCLSGDPIMDRENGVHRISSHEMDELFNNQEKVENSYEEGIVSLSNCETFKLLEEAFESLKSQLQVKSRTAKLWLNYLSYIQILKDFIRAERTGNWSLHLLSVSKMLNLFAATGHINYAKCSRLYLQNMINLHSEYPWVHKKFMEEGFHTVRRSSRFWAGLWTDLTIEQVLMRSMKTRGGLTRGRGVTESARVLWINTAHRCSSIHESMSQLTQTKHQTRAMHTEMGSTRVKKDNNDIDAILEWFRDHDPFDTQYPELRSLSSGIVAEQGNKINCDDSESVGEFIQNKLNGVPHNKAKISRSDHVKTLLQLQSGIKIDGLTVHIKPNVLFSRLTLLVQKKTDREKYFDHSMTPEPASLFADGMMRKSDKSKLRNHLLKKEEALDDPDAEVSIIDGGDLLYQTSWTQHNTYRDVCEGYVRYVAKNFTAKSVWIVFDGDTHADSTKNETHARRDVGRQAATVGRMDLDMKVSSSKMEFMKNRANKMQFVTLLSSALQLKGFNVLQSTGDADVMTCKQALHIAREGRSVEICGRDTDLLINLIYHWEENMTLFFRTKFKSNDGNGTHEGTMWWNVENFVKREPLRKLLVFAHVWTGCDTTSAIYRQGKLKILNQLKSMDVQEIATMFYQPESSPEAIGKAGVKLMKKMYGGSSEESLTSLRYRKWVEGTMISNEVDPALLPPSERATHFHSLRVHLECMRILSLDINCGLDPCLWGWERKNGVLKPVKTDKPVAPEFLLKVIRCNCKSSSRNACATQVCTCKKNGLPCVPACGSCRGLSCCNSEIETESNIVDNTTILEVM